ncbi:hypothetical protein ACIBBB_25895 [Streptomyces sp. NPDC051217]|uniref:hypothetical protein n=1 Tax=Streptomyces sp. NPDC051217 TaxID=3365644 RepID=UPI0037BC81A1
MAREPRDRAPTHSLDRGSADSLSGRLDDRADPDSRIMKNSDGANIQTYNAQAVVDAKHHVITADGVATNPSYALNHTTALDQSARNTGRIPSRRWSTTATAPRAIPTPRGPEPHQHLLRLLMNGCAMYGA